MPVLFVVVGVLCISSLFGFVSCKSFFDKLTLTISFLFILFGYFVSDFFVSGVSFNLFFLIAYICLALLGFKYIRASFFDLCFLFLLGVSYYFLLNSDLSFMVGYYSVMKPLLALILFAIYRANVYKSAIMSLFSSFVFVCISAYFGFDNFGVVNFDFVFCFEVMLYSVLFSMISFLFSLLMEKMYVKKSFVVSNINSFRNGAVWSVECKG